MVRSYFNRDSYLEMYNTVNFNSGLSRIDQIVESRNQKIK